MTVPCKPISLYIDLTDPLWTDRYAPRPDDPIGKLVTGKLEQYDLPSHSLQVFKGVAFRHSPVTLLDILASTKLRLSPRTTQSVILGPYPWSLVLVYQVLVSSRRWFLEAFARGPGVRSTE